MELFNVYPLYNVNSVEERGQMLGTEFNFEVGELIKNIIFEKHIFTGLPNNKNVLRISLPLTILKEEINQFRNALKDLLYE